MVLKELSQRPWRYDTKPLSIIMQKSFVNNNLLVFIPTRQTT